MLNKLKSQPILRALHNRSFALLWGGQTLSRIGDHLYQIALAWWVLEATGSAVAMASVLIFSFGPTILFTLLGGVMVDRYSRLGIMLTSDVVRGLTALIVASLALTNQLEIWHVYVLSLIFGFVDAFFQPAYTAIIPVIVDKEDLQSANALTSFGIQTGRVAGPALATLIISLSDIATTFAINGLTFFASALLLLPLRHITFHIIKTDNSPSPNLISEFKEGLKTVTDAPWLWISILLFALSNITLAGPYSVSLPFLVNDTLGADVGTLSLLYALFAVGYVIGGLWVGQQDIIRHRDLLMYGGLAVAGLMLALFGLPIGIVGLAIAALVNGAALEVGNLAWISSLQERIPSHKLGRVSSVDTVGSIALLPIGLGLTGWATELVGAPLMFILGGGITALLALIAFRHPDIRAI